MAYGLQLFNKNGANIMDTNERFTRVFGTYTNNVIKGTRYYGSSRYCELNTFILDVPVSLPTWIHNWSPVVISASAVFTSGAQLNTQGKTTSYNYDMVKGMVYYSNVSQALFNATSGNSPLLSAQKLSNGGPIVRVSYVYMAALRHKDTDATAYTERKATCSFIVVGY